MTEHIIEDYDSNPLEECEESRCSSVAVYTVIARKLCSFHAAKEWKK